MKKEGKHPILKLLWRRIPEGIIFQDDVLYNNSEISIMQKKPTKTIIENIHLAKKMFNAEVIA